MSNIFSIIQISCINNHMDKHSLDSIIQSTAKMQNENKGLMGLVLH
jgi:hypothetical protein